MAGCGVLMIDKPPLFLLTLVATKILPGESQKNQANNVLSSAETDENLKFCLNRLWTQEKSGNSTML